MLDRTPKVFISYSWTSEDYQNRVIEFATRLRQQHSVDVKLDVWDLKAGQDTYKFMEQCVTNPDIDRVLILCDKRYAEKADGRKGGVGDETAIITPEVYGNVTQEKFIPVVMEKDVNGVPYIPTYLRSRKYVDMAGMNYEKGYKELLRIIYEEPARRRPELGGTPPVWLTEDEPSVFYPLKQLMLKGDITNANGIAKKNFKRDFIDAYINTLKPFYKSSYSTNQEYLEDWDKLKVNRDMFLDYLQFASQETGFSYQIADIFEKLYNKLNDINTFVTNVKSFNEISFDIFNVHIWELFICTVAYMLHFELYADIYKLLNHTYFLRQSVTDSTTCEYSYRKFCFQSVMLENNIKQQIIKEKNEGYYSVAGHFIHTERENKPIYTSTSLANADLLLYQIYNGLNLEKLKFGVWYPFLYIYSDGNKELWKRLTSKSFCDQIMPLFNVKTYEELAEKILQCKSSHAFYYPGYWNRALDIMDLIDAKDVATLP